MSGRFGGRRAGRAGQGRGRRNLNNTNANKSIKKKGLEDYFFYVGSSKQVLDYKITSEFILNHIKKEFSQGNDIAEALRNLQPADIN